MNLDKRSFLFIVMIIGLLLTSCNTIAIESNNEGGTTPVLTNLAIPSETLLIIPTETKMPTKIITHTPDLTSTYWPPEVTKMVPEEYKQYIGITIPPYPDGWDEGWTWLLYTSEDEKAMGDWMVERLYNTGNQEIILFSRISGYSEGHAIRVVYDILTIPLLKPKEKIISSWCTVNGKVDHEIMILYQSKEVQLGPILDNDQILRAWRANRNKGVFEEISKEGLEKCRLD